MLFIDNRHMWLWHVLSSAPTTSGSGSGDDDVHGHGQWRHQREYDALLKPFKTRAGLDSADVHHACLYG